MKSNYVYHTAAHWLGLFGGTVTTLFGALTRRLMWHAGKVRQSKRKFFGKEIVCEIPVAVGSPPIHNWPENTIQEYER